MGSSCFSRGNRATLQVIQKYLKDHQLEQEVVLRGNHCFSDCSKGPVLKIGHRLYESVDQDSVIEILENELANQ